MTHIPLNRRIDVSTEDKYNNLLQDLNLTNLIAFHSETNLSTPTPRTLGHQSLPCYDIIRDPIFNSMPLDFNSIKNKNHPHQKDAQSHAIDTGNASAIRNVNPDIKNSLDQLLFESIPGNGKIYKTQESIAYSAARDYLVKRATSIVTANESNEKCAKNHPIVNLDKGVITISLPNDIWRHPRTELAITELCAKLPCPILGPIWNRETPIQDHETALSRYKNLPTSQLPCENVEACKGFFAYLFRLISSQSSGLSKTQLLHVITKNNPETFSLFKKHVLRDSLSDFEAIHLPIAFLQSPPISLSEQIARFISPSLGSIPTHLATHPGLITPNHPVLSHQKNSINEISCQILKMTDDFKFVTNVTVHDENIVFEAIEQSFSDYISAFFEQTLEKVSLLVESTNYPRAIMEGYAEQQRERYILLAHRPYIYAVAGRFIGLPPCGQQTARKAGERSAAAFKNKPDQLNNMFLILDAVATFPGFKGKKNQIVSWIAASCIYIQPTSDLAKVSSIASSSYDRLKAEPIGDSPPLDSAGNLWYYKYPRASQNFWPSFDNEFFV